jgi:hypothetical protein
LHFRLSPSDMPKSAAISSAFRSELDVMRDFGSPLQIEPVFYGRWLTTPCSAPRPAYHILQVL